MKNGDQRQMAAKRCNDSIQPSQFVTVLKRCENFCFVRRQTAVNGGKWRQMAAKVFSLKLGQIEGFLIYKAGCYDFYNYFDDRPWL
jgi:hypothetical protein